MAWYYMRGSERMGPVGEPEFEGLVQSGAIAAQTYVWRDGMAQWQRYGDLQPQDDGIPGANYICAECGGMFPSDEMVRYGEQWVCAGCKPTFFQRLKEGAVLPGVLNYAGFWIRFCAVVVDGILLMIVNAVLSAVTGTSMSFTPGAEATPEELARMGTGFMISWLLSAAISISYETFFIGKFGATPGKMLLGLRVVRPDGDRVTYMRAFARFFAKILSQIILFIGYIMAAFDDEKRALHDRICDTRVVRK